MRKVSKSRVDDDVISSTNGSTANDDHGDNGDAGDDKPTSEGRDSAINDSTNNDFDANSDVDSQKSTEKQKSSKKRKSLKRKSGKEDANTDEEDNNDDDASYVSKEGKKKGKKGVQNKKRKSARDKSVTNYDDNEENDEKEDEDNNDDDASHASKEGKKKAKKGAQNKKRKSARDKSVTNNDDNNEEEDDDEEEYEVEKVVGSKKIKGKLHYLIRWKGYSASSDTWEPENTLSCPELINKYNEEKENSIKKDDKSTPKKKKKGKKEVSPAKRPKTEWDGEKADKNAEYEVARILEVHHKKNGDREFLIHWKGWSSKFDSWEPERHLNCPDLIEKFMEKVKASSYADNRNLRVAPETTNRFTLQDPTGGRRLSKRRGQRQRVRYDDAE